MLNDNSIKDMQKIKLSIIHIIFPLTIGGIIYISFRSTSLKMFIWFKQIGVGDSVLTLRHQLSGIESILPRWIYLSLPDGLWVYSFTSALLIIWENQFRNAKFWLVFPLLTGIVTEIAQGIKLYPGTFDILDLVFSIIASLLSIVIINIKYIQNEKG
jgi:hypothetical protein